MACREWAHLSSPSAGLGDLACDRGSVRCFSKVSWDECVYLPARRAWRQFVGKGGVVVRGFDGCVRRRHLRGRLHLRYFYRVPNTDGIDAIIDAIESDSVAAEFHLNLQNLLPWPTSLKLKNALLALHVSTPAPPARSPPLKAALTTSSTPKNASIARLARAVAPRARSRPARKDEKNARFPSRRFNASRWRTGCRRCQALASVPAFCGRDHPGRGRTRSCAPRGFLSKCRASTCASVFDVSGLG